STSRTTPPSLLAFLTAQPCTEARSMPPQPYLRTALRPPTTVRRAVGAGRATDAAVRRAALMLVRPLDVLPRSRPETLASREMIKALTWLDADLIMVAPWFPNDFSVPAARCLPECRAPVRSGAGVRTSVLWGE